MLNIKDGKSPFWCPIIPGFLSFTLLTFGARECFAVGSCLVRSKVFSSVPLLYPLDASRQPKMSPDMARRSLGGHSSPTESHCVTLSVRGPWLMFSCYEIVVRDYLYVSQSSFPVLLFDRDLASISARSDVGWNVAAPLCSPSISVQTQNLSLAPEPGPENAETCGTLRGQSLAWRSMSTKARRVRRGWVWKPSTNRW